MFAWICFSTLTLTEGEKKSVEDWIKNKLKKKWRKRSCERFICTFTCQVFLSYWAIFLFLFLLVILLFIERIVLYWLSIFHLLPANHLKMLNVLKDLVVAVLYASVVNYLHAFIPRANLSSRQYVQAQPGI